MADTNAFDGTAWSIDGAEHPASLLRLAAYAFTSGAEGIIAPGDLKVSQLAAAGPQVRMAAGAAEILNRSGNGNLKQSYIVSASGESRLDVTETDETGPRSDLVCVRVEDPEFGPFQGPGSEEAALNWQYVKPFIKQNVPASTRRWSQVGETYSAYAVARIDIPANTTAITDAMIKDLREVARPHSKQLKFQTVPAAPQALISGPWNPWATFADRDIEVPDWATRAIIEVKLAGVLVYAGDTWGDIRARVAIVDANGITVQGVTTSPVAYDYNTPAVNNVDRDVLFTAGEVDVSAFRGQVVRFGLEGHKDGGGTAIEVNTKSVIISTIEFLESPV